MSDLSPKLKMKPWVEAVIALFTICALLGGFAVWVVGEARAETMKLAERVARNEAEVGEVRKDVRAVYQYLLTRQRQDRLEDKP